MKKLIVLSVIFALVVGGVFAADVSGSVIGTVNVVEGSTAKVVPDGADFKAADISASGEMNRVRIEASGENDDGTFGAWFRLDGRHWSGEPNMEGLAWWQPMDMLKVQIGGNSDGIFGKEGVTGWMFYQTATDTGVGFGGDNVWGGSIYGFGLKTRDAFYSGFGGEGLLLTVTPIEMLAFNFVIPYMGFGGGKAEKVYKNMTAQADVNLDGIGNIALTWESRPGKLDADLISGDLDATSGKVFLYFGLTAVENLGLDVGIGYTLPVSEEYGAVKVTYNAPIAVGLGAKYDAGQFGVKFRALAEFAEKAKIEGGGVSMEGKGPFGLLVDVLPYFVISDTFRAFLSIGVGYVAEAKDPDGNKIADSMMGWSVNPYVEIGEEWGPKFLAGIKLSQGPGKDAKGDKYIDWAIPLAMTIGF